MLGKSPDPVGIQLASVLGMVSLLHHGLRKKPPVQWQHLLFVKGEMFISCGVELRSDGTYAATLFPLWSPIDQVTEVFTDPSDAAEWHMRMGRRLQAAGWLLNNTGVVTTAA